MTSGKPFSKEEDDFIRLNCNEKYPSVIARYLGIHYSEHNGGFRSTKSVAERMAYWVEQLNPHPVQELMPPPKKTIDARKLNGRRKKTTTSSSQPNQK